MIQIYYWNADPPLKKKSKLFYLGGIYCTIVQPTLVTIKIIVLDPNTVCTALVSFKRPNTGPMEGNVKCLELLGVNFNDCP